MSCRYLIVFLVSRHFRTFFRMYRDSLKGGPVLLGNSQTRPGINLSQPRAPLLCIFRHVLITGRRVPCPRGLDFVDLDLGCSTILLR